MSPDNESSLTEFDEVMAEFRAEMDRFEETMAEVDDLLAEYEAAVHGVRGDAPSETTTPGETVTSTSDPSQVTSDLTVSLEDWR
jgi:hypothetical protein